MRIIYTVFLLITISGGLSFAQPAEPVDKPKIVNIDNTQSFVSFATLKLDDEYVDLLDSRNSSEEEFRKVYSSWADFHQQVAGFVKEKDFKWEVEDSIISVISKIYFNKEGKVEYYGFKILNSSVSDEKKEEFANILEQFSSNVDLTLNRDDKFSQCGKIKYINK